MCLFGGGSSSGSRKLTVAAIPSSASRSLIGLLLGLLLVSMSKAHFGQGANPREFSRPYSPPGIEELDRESVRSLEHEGPAFIDIVDVLQHGHTLRDEPSVPSI